MIQSDLSLPKKVEATCLVCASVERFYSRYVNKRIRGTLTSSRNKPDIKLRIEPFPPSVAERWFEIGGDGLPCGKDFSITFSSEHEKLDLLFGDWRRVPVMLEGQYNDGWWQVRDDQPVRIRYSYSGMYLDISFKATKYNKFGMFQCYFLVIQRTGSWSLLW